MTRFYCFAKEKEKEGISQGDVGHDQVLLFCLEKEKEGISQGDVGHDQVLLFC